jgi:Fe-Mn family superoxide dismutase
MREELIATNSMILHEICFSGLRRGRATFQSSRRARGGFGSPEAWHQQFAAMGKAQSGGSG